MECIGSALVRLNSPEILVWPQNSAAALSVSGRVRTVLVNLCSSPFRHAQLAEFASSNASAPSAKMPATRKSPSPHDSVHRFPASTTRTSLLVSISKSNPQAQNARTSTHVWERPLRSACLPDLDGYLDGYWICRRFSTVAPATSRSKELVSVLFKENWDFHECGLRAASHAVRDRLHICNLVNCSCTERPRCPYTSTVGGGFADFVNAIDCRYCSAIVIAYRDFEALHCSAEGNSQPR